MLFKLGHLLCREKTLVHKVWLENDGKPVRPEYREERKGGKPAGSVVVLWTRQAEASALVSKYSDRYPGVAMLFWGQHTSPVMRSDILRMLIVYDRGGIYSDFDIEWDGRRMSFDHDLVLWTEYAHSDATVQANKEFTREHRGEVAEYNIRIANAVFWSRKAHSPLLARCMARMQERLVRNSHAPLSPYGVLYTTGPDVLTDAVVEGLPGPDTLKPFDAREHFNAEWVDLEGERVLLLGREPGSSIATHRTHGNWRESQRQT